MLSENAEIKISLYHVSPDAEDIDAISFGKDDPDIQDIVTKASARLIGQFYVDATQKFKEAGIVADRVETITTKRKAGIGKMILSEAKKGNYGTVVVGRRGADRAHNFGSVSRYVTQRITDRALWLVP